MTDTPTIATAYFEAALNIGVAEDALDEALVAAVGFTTTQPTEWPFGHIVYDWYDSSFEFQGARIDWAPTADQLTAAFALGFARCWICYVDGGQRYFAPGSMQGALTKSTYHGGVREHTRVRYQREQRLRDMLISAETEVTNACGALSFDWDFLPERLRRSARDIVREGLLALSQTLRAALKDLP